LDVAADVVEPARGDAAVAASSVRASPPIVGVERLELVGHPVATDGDDVAGRAGGHLVVAEVADRHLPMLHPGV
jgi:hypothetical protein